MYYLCSENKGADQLRGYREADLRLCFRICKTLVFSRSGSNKILRYLSDNTKDNTKTVTNGEPDIVPDTELNNRGIKHDFPFINIRKVPREVLKTEGEARGFQPSRETLRMLMNDKIMFDRYYCINSAKRCENEENIDAIYSITSSHFPTQVRF